MKLARVSLLLLLMLLSILSIIPLGRANTTTIRPNANGDVIQLFPYPSELSNYQCVDDEVADDDATYVTSTELFGNPVSDLYQLSSVYLPSGAVIDKVTVYIRVKSYLSSIPNSFRTLIKTHGTVYKGTWMEQPATWTTMYTEYAKNPYTYNRWSKSEVDALQAGVDIWKVSPYVGGPIYNGRCTQVWVEIQYLEVSVLAEDQYGNSLTTGDVYIDYQWRGLTGSTFTVAAGTHTVIVNHFWESGGTGYRYGFQHWEDGSVDNPRTITVVEDMTIKAHFKKKWCPGDVNGDGIVDGEDQILVGSSLWAERGVDPRWDSRADVNGDGSIDGGDQIIVGNNLWNEYPDP